MYVDALAEGSRTRVRFPPPPPYLKEKALETKGLFHFWVAEISVSKRFPGTALRRTELSLLTFILAYRLVMAGFEW